MTISIRPFTPDEWADLRAIRLRALQNHPDVFSSNYKREEAYDEARWREMIAQDTGCVFGLYDGDKVIGLTGVFVSRDDPTGKTAVFAMSYIDPAYRGQKLSRYLYEARIGWAQAQPQIEKIVISHRESNEASRRANQAFGFQHIDTQAKDWPDGTSENEMIYQLDVTTLKP